MFQIKSFTFNPFSQNTYIVYNDDKDAYIIDPGNFTDEETNVLEQFIADNDLKVKNENKKVNNEKVNELVRTGNRVLNILYILCQFFIIFICAFYRFPFFIIII